MKLITDDDTLVVRAEHFNEEQLLRLIRNTLKDYDLTALKFQSNCKGELVEICAIDVDYVHEPFTPDEKDCAKVYDILKKKAEKEG